MSTVFLSEDFIQHTSWKIHSGQGMWGDIGYELRRKAEQWLHKGPWSITYYPSPAESGNPHDYFSEGPYWWPDPQNPAGPYIRRDGEKNPDRFTHHRDAMEEMAEGFLMLCYAGVYLEETCWLDRAAEILKVWFLDKYTCMNPHLEYGQAVRGVCSGRGIGIIDLSVLLKVISGMELMSQTSQYGDILSGMKEWFTKLLEWMVTSEKGQNAKNNGNNHSTYWNVQVAAYAAFAGKKDLVLQCFSNFRDVLLPAQMAADGSFPEELERTLSFSYSLMNLDGFALLCEIAYSMGVDLWNYKTPDGRGMEKGIQFVLPYLDNPYHWKYPQINGWIPGENYAVQLAGHRLGIEGCDKINKKRRGDSCLVSSQHRIGPLVFQPGFDAAAL